MGVVFFLQLQKSSHPPAIAPSVAARRALHCVWRVEPITLLNMPSSGIFRRHPRFLEVSQFAISNLYVGQV